MIGFFTSRHNLRKFITSLVLAGFLIFEVGIPLAPIARAEADPSTPPPPLLMRAYEGTDPNSMIFVLNNDDSGGGNWVSLPYATFTTAEISKTNADVTIAWQVEDPWRSGVTLTDCTLYGGVAARSVPPQTGSLVLHDPTPGLYIMNCNGSGGLASANVQLRVAGRHPSFGNYPAFFCDPGNLLPFLYKSENYDPGSRTGPQPSSNDRSNLKDASDACVILGIDADVAGYAPWSYIGPPSMVDDRIGWPASRVHVDRTTTVRYKDPQIVTACTNIIITATQYRVGFAWHAERIEGESNIDYRVYDPFEISHESPVTETKEECIDRPLNDTIITTNIATCGTNESYHFFSTEYHYQCYTNALAANGKAATCHYEKTSSVFGGIFSWIMPMLMLAAGPFLSWLVELIGVFIPTQLAFVAALSPVIKLGFIEAITSIASLLKLYGQGILIGMAGSVSAPDPGLGECAWSQGFAPQTAGEPLCASGCAFDPKSVTEGGKVNYPWNFSQAVSRFDFFCTGDLGRWSGNVPADAPYSGNAEFYPRQSQSCTLTLANSAGATKTYTDAVTVTPLASAPTCLLSFSPNQINDGDAAVAAWKMSPDTARADYLCNGDIGSHTGLSIPRDLPYEGEANVTPYQSQQCTLNVYDVSGQRGSCSASIAVSPASVGTIQGFKVKMPGNRNITPPGAEAVTIDGQRSTAVNPYFFTSVPAGRHTVSVSIPPGWAVGYTLCYSTEPSCGAPYDPAGYHSAVPTSVNLANLPIVVNVPSGGYADLWWHYQEPSAVGTIVWAATLDSRPWSGSIAVNGTTPNGPVTDYPIPTGTYYPLPVGAYTYRYASGGPPGAIFTGVAPSETQTLAADGTIAFIFNFTSGPGASSNAGIIRTAFGLRPGGSDNAAPASFFDRVASAFSAFSVLLGFLSPPPVR